MTNKKVTNKDVTTSNEFALVVIKEDKREMQGRNPMMGLRLQFFFKFSW